MRVLNWKEKEAKAKKMTVAELEYAVQDCVAARDASKGWNPENENYYQDEASVYSRELRKRLDKWLLKKNRKNSEFGDFIC